MAFLKCKKQISVLSLFLSLLGCGPGGGFSPIQGLSSSGGADPSNGGRSDSGVEIFHAQDLSGIVNGGPTDQASVIVYDTSEEAIQLRIPIPGLIGTLENELPNVPGSRVFLDNTHPFVPVLVISIPGVYVLGKLGFEVGDLGLDPTKLPNGQPLPFTPGGEPPKISFLIPKVNRLVQIYLGINVIGVYVESNFDPMADLTFPIQNSTYSETIGYFSTIRRRVPYQGGFFVSLVMPPRIAGALDDHLRKVIVP